MKKMKKLRTYERTALYNASWDLGSVLWKCQEKGIDGYKVGHALARCHNFMKKFTPDRMGGALVVIFRLLEEN